MQTTITWVCAAILIVLIIASLLAYLNRGAYFKKGEYGKHFVGKQLKSYSSNRDVTILSDVSVNDGEKAVHFDHVLIGYFGVLFLQSIQGSGSFWGDGKQEYWAFTDSGKSKIIFKNPLTEMDEKVQVFRRALGKNKVYNVPVHSAVVIVTMGQAPKMYLSNIKDDGSILLEKQLREYLHSEMFEQDNKVDPKAIAEIFYKEEN